MAGDYGTNPFTGGSSQYGAVDRTLSESQNLSEESVEKSVLNTIKDNKLPSDSTVKILLESKSQKDVNGKLDKKIASEQKWGQRLERFGLSKLAKGYHTRANGFTAIKGLVENSFAPGEMEKFQENLKKMHDKAISGGIEEGLRKSGLMGK